ncbi:TetR/AcrR family transcriptional regulator [Photorhabdus noenieputensis]|uniref:TetR/AcrR family transcriptional regulator n=1 Tax=Photorhabdus noenieputensis TaxID=1208607 RepID=UPI001FD06923|nr:TetR/AcrR family transcriptional regulator [Photorhabdus noenieputensis]MCK3671081.1 TetR/AcrR family transcriptional regulator [Photorhabdus noenieputensis]
MQMNRNPQDIRQHILDIAQQIIGCKGFSAVGLNEILKAAEVPKGSFYHYFASKDAFGAAMLEDYFTHHLERMDNVMARKEWTAKENLMQYWQGWLEPLEDGTVCGQKCLAVKLGAEVSDLSIAMRLVLENGTKSIVMRLASVVESIVHEGGLDCSVEEAFPLAEALYQTWLGASLMAKITQSSAPLQSAMATTKRLLNA